ncbi:MAG TPA: FAD-dependent oxidoreductase [Acidimicrobiia bacterium]|nr:FAD-dependent oxidoreductase [Acidimicrobiia bacterium]
MALAYFDANIPCLAACPVHTNAGLYVSAIADGDDRTAYLAARLPNPFPSVCGRVCAAPCEEACRRGLIDQPIAIRALKRFVTEQHGVEAGPDNLWHDLLTPGWTERREKVAVIGGGPTGLSAAHDLRQLGYQVTIYEATSQLGGMMVLGIPEYRLDRRLLAAEIDSIVQMGVDVIHGMRLGSDLSLDELRTSYDAVCLAFGATLGRGLDIEGHDADGVFRAIEFLINVNQGFRVEVGKRVVVIGGGNVALDAARTALRAEAYEGSHAIADLEFGAVDTGASMTEAVDVARSAVRAGAKDVLIVALEADYEMPATSFEIAEARLEGIRFVHRHGPSRIVTREGKVVGLETIGVVSVFDEEGRFAPKFDETDRETFPADTVIMAIGQGVDLAALGADGPAVTRRGTIEVDQETMRTSLADVWAGGDVAHGPRNLIDAIADGRRIASQIHNALSDAVEEEPIGRMDVLTAFHRLDDRYDRHGRVDIPSLPSPRRIGLREVELGFTENQARLEASRCLRCFANIILDTSACVLCGLCVDVCPVDVISLQPAATLGMGGGTALLLDETRCIRCALCVERCPTNALSMGVWSGASVPTLSSVPVTIGGAA